MSEPPNTLVELARRYGVATEYQDWTGRTTAVTESTLAAVLAALGVATASEDDRSAALIAHERERWQRSLPPVVVGRTIPKQRQIQRAGDGPADAGGIGRRSGRQALIGVGLAMRVAGDK